MQSETRYDVAGLGNALVDALVRVDDDDLLAELGVVRGHMTPVDHDRWQQAFQKVQSNGVEIQSGGSCANTVAGLGFMGARAIYCGQVGDDQLGHLYASNMREACGQDALVWTKERHTGKCLSIISTRDAERTMLTDLGGAVHLPCLGEFADIIRQSRLLHVTGYLMLGEPMASRLREAATIARQAGVPVSIDVADPFVVSTVRKDMWEVVREYADMVFLNADEAKAMSQGTVARALAELGDHVETVVLKLGPRGSLVKYKDELIPVQARPVTPVDTTGAGDAYAAGYIYGHLHGWTPSMSAQLGSRVAALTVGQLGAVVRDRTLLQRAIDEVQGLPRDRRAEDQPASA